MSDPTAKESRAVPQVIHLLNFQRVTTVGAALWFVFVR
jgi:hypothetical protein